MKNVQTPETLRELLKFLAGAPEYCVTWKENGNFYGAKRTTDGKFFLRRNGNPVPLRTIRLSAKRVLAENWEVVHYAVE